ncbi:GNAT family N-acetyltransferase [Defluviitalea phaphyphila]|uniref:GNAT family N-acetyltransferase n=1 Tax=Defluviitalea phaphyphila TaxID=1473580 RepID=UPI00072FB4D3|nr:GNAT family N-acetyltransferase [Defluviitalea phaphyphila]
MNIEKVFYNKACKDSLYIRKKVFMEEQGFKNEIDDYDNKGIHLVLYIDEKPVATGRLHIKDMDSKIYKIGRIAVLKEYRNKQLGKKIIEILEAKAKKEGAKKIVISAQCQAQDFYKKNGYIAKGDIYYEEFCPHIYMEKIIN